MSPSWIPLPASWKLEDVQAALNVVITVFSALGIFVFVRLCWQSGVAKVSRNHSVRLSSLLSLNSVGEAYDVIRLLKRNVLSIQHLKLLSQCLVVVFLSTTTIVAGPIARYSTRRGHVVTEVAVPGLLATRNHNSITYANVQWNLTEVSLNRAHFPLDQMLDFLPDPSTHWMYRTDEWNNTWSLTCNRTDQTSISLHATGNCTSRLMDEIPSLQEVMPRANFNWSYRSWSGFYDTLEVNKDILLFITGTSMWDYDDTTEFYNSMKMSVAAFHLHEVPRQQNDSSLCEFGVGPIGPSTFTKIDCELETVRRPPDDMRAAYPDSSDLAMISSAYTAYYSARFIQESTSNSTITVIGPDELVRFYQTYVISKDLQYKEPVTRMLSIEQTVVQLSTVFLVIALTVALLICLGGLKYAVFAYRHRHVLPLTPQSKLDWMLQSIQAGSPGLTRLVAFRGAVTSDVSLSHDLDTLRPTQRMRVEFETARYEDRRAAGSWVKDSTHTPGLSSIGDDNAELGGMSLHDRHMPRTTPDKTPMLTVDVGDDDAFARFR